MNHCEHCAEGCQGGTVWDGEHLHLHTNIADPTADYTWSCVWESGSCPACTERERIVAWLRGAAIYDAADFIARGAHLEDQ